jgi:hypothetical protein
MTTRVLRLRLLPPKASPRPLPPEVILKHIDHLQVLALTSPRFVRTVLKITDVAAAKARRLKDD